MCVTFLKNKILASVAGIYFILIPGILRNEVNFHFIVL